MSVRHIGQSTAILFGLAIALSTSAHAAVHTQITQRRSLSSEIRHVTTEAHQNCLSFDITDMRFPTTSSLAPRTLTVSATVRLLNGCSTTTNMSLILSDSSGSNGFTMHANNVALPLRLFVGTDATGVEAWNGKPISIGQLGALHPEMHIFGEVQTPDFILPGTYSDNISAILMNNP